MHNPLHHACFFQQLRALPVHHRAISMRCKCNTLLPQEL